MKTFRQFHESASSKLYYYRSVDSALNILSKQEFRLSYDGENQSEKEMQMPGRPFFLSMTRSKLGDYTKSNSFSGNVVFNLKGDWFNQHYKAKAVDYWGPAWLRNKDEMEDRIYSKGPVIGFKNPHDVIDSIHVLIKPNETRQNLKVKARDLLLLGKKLGIPVSLYDDTNAFINQDERKRVPLDHDNLKRLLGGVEETKPNWPRSDFLSRYRELWWKNKVEDLSKEAASLVGPFGSKNSIAQQMSNDINNERKGASKSLLYTLNVLKYSKSKTVPEYAEKMWRKWYKIKYGEEYDR